MMALVTPLIPRPNPSQYTSNWRPKFWWRALGTTIHRFLAQALKFIKFDSTLIEPIIHQKPPQISSKFPECKTFKKTRYQINQTATKIHRKCQNPKKKKTQKTKPINSGFRRNFAKQT
jgi:hypothetical protein